MFRLLWLTFFGASRMTSETARHIHESPPSMTGVLVALAALSAIGGFITIPHYLEPLLPAPIIRPGLEHLERTLMIVSVAFALAGLLGAWILFSGGAGPAQRLAVRFAPLHRLLSAKYYVDEAYDRLIGRPLYWISERVFLHFGDQKFLDGGLNGMAAWAQRSSAAMARLQNGSLHRYALLVVAGAIASLAWSWRHG
jgi:NADH-quinone oxidoreductase subunit L